MFNRYIGIDYSGARAPDDSLKGLRVYSSTLSTAPEEVGPPPGPKRYWTRRGLAEWLDRLLESTSPTIIGIDHAFSFPERYFERHGIDRNWDAFLDDFYKHWPSDREFMYLDFIRHGRHGRADLRGGNTRWRRLTEVKSGSAKSVFHFDVPGQVAKSSHTGIPWLRFLRRSKGDAVHFWPFDGWEIREGINTMVEVYPRLWSAMYLVNGRTQDQHDAFSICYWLRDADSDGDLVQKLQPDLTPAERETAGFEG